MNALNEQTAEAAQENLIPRNPSIAPDESTSRFSSALWYNKVKEKSIILAGCGGIGSYVGFLLGRMKPQMLTIYDSDVVEVGNLSGQLFGMRDVGRHKVYALQERITDLDAYHQLYCINRKFTPTSQGGPIMICGFDNMAARGIFYMKWKEQLERGAVPAEQCLFIDGRLAAEEFQVFAITGDNEAAMQRYERDFLFPDGEAEATLCSYKQTSYMANMIGSVIVNIFTNFCANECGLVFPREVPFLTTYRADYMDFKIER